MFDPLHKWLGIPPDEQPPNHYRLLGIADFEHDTDVIDAAADKQLAFLHDLTNGEYAEQAEQLSNQVSAARLCLRNQEKKNAYDETLRSPAHGPRRDQLRSASPLIDPAYDVSAPAEKKPDRPDVRVKATQPTRKTPSRPRWFWRVSTLLCVVALAVIAIGVAQGRLVLNRTVLESIGLASSETPKPITTAPDSIPLESQPPRAPETPTSESSSVESPSAEDRPADPPPAKKADAGPQPPKPRRSLGDLLHSTQSADESSPVVKSPRPSESQVDEKLNLIRELYQDEYRDANTPAQRIELAKLMHREGQKTTDDPIGRFALWRVARDIMKREGEYTSALAIVDNLDAHYADVDASMLKVEILRDSSSRAAVSGMAGFLAAIELVVTQCRNQEKFGLAKSLCEFAQQDLDQRINDVQRSELKKLETEIRVAEGSFQRYEQALVALKESEDNPKANQDAGQYLCFIRGQWEPGLKYLALAADSTVRSAAELELASPSGASQSIAVADAWFDIAQQQSGSVEQTTIRRHSLDWYRKAQDDAKGLERRKVDARIASLEKLVPAGADQRDVPEVAPVNVIGYRVKTSSESRSDFANRKGNQFHIGMGPRPDGRGEAQAGIELAGVEKLTVVGSASHKDLPEIDKYSKVGFVVDYHTPGGYSKRVFLGLGLRPGREFSEAPLWGTAKPPEVTTDLGRAAAYEIDLTRWAPSTWDGQCWFTIYMQNAGPGRSLNATVSW